MVKKKQFDFSLGPDTEIGATLDTEIKKTFVAPANQQGLFTGQPAIHQAAKNVQWIQLMLNPKK